MLEQKENPVFKRIGTDLFLEKSVNLVDALTGAHFHIPTLDNRSLEVTSAGTVIKPDAWMCVKGEGMPIQGRPYDKGNLYIHFTVEFPEAVSEAQAAALRSAFGPATNGVAPMDAEHVEEVTLAVVKDMESEIKARREWEKRSGADAYNSDSDEDMPGRGQRVSCAQQ